MADELPYLSSYKNVGLLFERIADAKVPQTFTHAFLSDTLGLKSSGDRSLIPLLRTLGFLDASNKPTSEYKKLKNESEAKRAVAAASRKAYGPLFEANERAHTLSNDEAKGLISQVAGTDAGMTGKILGTFNALKAKADFALLSRADEDQEDEEDAENGDGPRRRPLRPEFHYNIQVHLPANATEETYLDIFNALRKAFE